MFSKKSNSKKEIANETPELYSQTIKELNKIIDFLKEIVQDLINKSFRKIELSIDDKWRVFLKKDLQSILKLNKKDKLFAYLGNSFLLIPQQTNLNNKNKKSFPTNTN